MRLIHMIGQVAINMGDLERSLAFYVGKLGFKERSRHEGRDSIIVMNKKDEAKMEIFGLKNPTQPEVKPTDIGLRHIAFYVDDVEEAYEELKDRGVEFTMEPRSFRGRPPIAFFKDPG